MYDSRITCVARGGTGDVNYLKEQAEMRKKSAQRVVSENTRSVS